MTDSKMTTGLTRRFMSLGVSDHPTNHDFCESETLELMNTSNYEITLFIFLILNDNTTLKIPTINRDMPVNVVRVNDVPLSALFSLWCCIKLDHCIEYG